MRPSSKRRASWNELSEIMEKTESEHKWRAVENDQRSNGMLYQGGGAENVCNTIERLHATQFRISVAWPGRGTSLVQGRVTAKLQWPQDGRGTFQPHRIR